MRACGVKEWKGRSGFVCDALAFGQNGAFFGRVGVDVGGRDLALRESNLVSCWAYSVTVHVVGSANGWSGWQLQPSFSATCQHAVAWSNATGADVISRQLYFRDAGTLDLHHTLHYTPHLTSRWQ